MPGATPRTPRENEYYGTVKAVLPFSVFEIELSNGHVIKGKPAGRMRRNKIRIWTGDKVIVMISPYDPSVGRITYRID